MNFLVPRECILICQISIFESYDRKCGALNKKDLSEEEEYRMTIFMDGHIIDLKTGDIIMPLDIDDQGYVEGEIYANTMYIDTLYNPNSIDKDTRLRAEKVYKYYLLRKELIASKKLVIMQQKRLY